MSNTDLFGSIWIEKYRPKTFNDIVLSKEDKAFFQSLLHKQEIPHLLFAGTPGVGKSSLAKIIVYDILGAPDCLYINASDENSIDTVRFKLTGFARTKSFDGRTKIVILDEVDGMGMEAMKCLRNLIEEYAGTTRFILTCNYLFKIIPALQSRTQIFNLIPPIEGVVQRVKEILQKENITIEPDQKPLLLEHIRKNLPDVRRIINDVQKFSINGSLQIKNEVSTEFVKQIFDKIKNKYDLTKLRKEIIENEKNFSNDYRNFQKQLFEVIFSSDLNYELKTNCLITISDSMYSDAIVVDKEINCFACLINLSRNIS